MKSNLIYLLFILQLSSSVVTAQTCIEWFDSLDISSNNKKCLSICNTSETDMATSGCHSECEKLCKPKLVNKCKVDSIKINFGKSPNNWPWLDQKPLSLSESELNFFNTEIAKVNPDLLKTIDGIYFFEKPKDLFSAGTETSYYENQIIIYKRALDRKDLTIKIVHELGHGLHENSEKNNFNEYSKKYYTKDRKYLTADAKFSAEEDFATNFELYISNPNMLKNEIPKIFDWFRKKYL